MTGILSSDTELNKIFLLFALFLQLWHSLPYSPSRNRDVHKWQWKQWQWRLCSSVVSTYFNLGRTVYKNGSKFQRFNDDVSSPGLLSISWNYQKQSKNLLWLQKSAFCIRNITNLSECLNSNRCIIIKSSENIPVSVMRMFPSHAESFLYVLVSL